MSQSLVIMSVLDEFVECIQIVLTQRRRGWLIVSFPRLAQSEEGPDSTLEWGGRRIANSMVDGEEYRQGCQRYCGATDDEGAVQVLASFVQFGGDGCDVVK